MKIGRWIGMGALGAVFILSWQAVLRPVTLDPDGQPALPDPAIAFHTRDHDDAFDGIDRWAYAGMSVHALTERLRERGYACEQARAETGRAPDSGVHEVRCQKLETRLWARNLHIEASVDYRYGGRVVDLKAWSAPAGGETGLSRHFLALLRRFGVIEPAGLDIAGLNFDSADGLARQIADQLNGDGWSVHCAEAPPFALPDCGGRTARRKETGYPPLDPAKPVRTGRAEWIYRAMPELGLFPPAPLPAPADYLIVRVDDGGRLWMDFAGKDLTGRERAAAIELDPRGGRPLRVRVDTAGGQREFLLAGEAHTQDPSYLTLLAPLEDGAVPDRPGYRQAYWLTVTTDSHSQLLQRLARFAPAVMPAFRPALRDHLVEAELRAPRRASLNGPGPDLDAIASMIEVFGTADVHAWAPEHDSLIWLKRRHADRPGLRAAWFLSRCQGPRPETAGLESIGLDGSCWTRFALNDEQAAAAVRQALAAWKKRTGRPDGAQASEETTGLGALINAIETSDATFH